jgi:hypothetical protein
MIADRQRIDLSPRRFPFPSVGAFDGSFLPGRLRITEPCLRSDPGLQIGSAGKFGSTIEGDGAARTMGQGLQHFEKSGIGGLAWQRQVEIVAETRAFAARSRDRDQRPTSMLMLSLGAGTGCDAQYVFADDVLGANKGHVPRHAKIYRNFAAEYDLLQQERIVGFSEYVADVRSGAYPGKAHLVGIEPAGLGGVSGSAGFSCRGLKNVYTYTYKLFLECNP